MHEHFVEEMSARKARGGLGGRHALQVKSFQLLPYVAAILWLARLPDPKSGRVWVGVRHAPPRTTNIEFKKIFEKNLCFISKLNQASFFPMSWARQVKPDRSQGSRDGSSVA